MQKLSRLFNPIAITLALTLGAGIPESSANFAYLSSSQPSSIGCMPHTFNEAEGEIPQDDPRFFTDVTDCISAAKQINMGPNEIPAITITKIGGASFVLTLGILDDRPATNTGNSPYCVISSQPGPNDPLGRRIIDIKKAGTIGECLLYLLKLLRANGLPTGANVFVENRGLQFKIFQPKPQ